MAFYDLPKQQRAMLVAEIQENITSDLTQNTTSFILEHFSNNDTYIRKAGYLAVGRIYKANEKKRSKIIALLQKLMKHNNPKVRQTAINSAGEIGMMHFEEIEHLMENGLFDEHHSVRNAVIGSVKKMGERNPKPVLKFARKYLHHSDKEIRREICHGIELRGRKHPQDILPLLRELQNDTTARVRGTLVHVIGQISYKKGCLETVVADLKKWQNKQLVQDALEEIVDVHHRYRTFAAKTQKEAIAYIDRNF
jgi:HEAT repeat protein